MTTYNLDALGWYQFERLCQSLLHGQYGLAVESWGGSGDHGRDAYADGPLEFPEKGNSEPGPFIFQCKFVQGANAAGASPRAALLRAVRAERERIAARREGGDWEEPRVYALLTNVTLSTQLRGDVRAILEDALLRAQRIVVAGGLELDQWLDAFPRVRTAFPQLLGLRDLTSLLDGVVNRDVRARSTLGVEASADLARVFVPTRAYSRALNVLAAHNFVVLTGPPEMGKTAIARMILLARFTSGWDAIECRGPGDFFRLYDSDAPQAFLADDAFGSTEYRPELAMSWAADLPKILRATDYRHWLIWTSRPGPLNEGLAQLHLQDAATTFPSPGEVQVDASQLSQEEKALILYRHCKAALLEVGTADLVKAAAESIVDDPNFTPLRIQRLVNDQLPTIVDSDRRGRPRLLQAAITAGLHEVTQPMRTSFRALGEEHKQLLIAMLDAGASEVDMRALTSAYQRRFGGIAPRAAQDVASMIDQHFVHLSGHD